MRFETLKSRKKKYFLYALIVGVVLLLPLVLTFSRAKYQTTQSIKIVEGTIRNYSPADFSMIAVKLQNDSGEYESTNTIPTSGYAFNETESYCTVPDGSGNNINDSSIILEYKNGAMYFGNVTIKGTKCYLYFGKVPANVQELITAHVISTRTDFSTTVTTDTTGTIYTAEDDYGTSYYFAGNPTDNWVKFAGFYWRIIRINGDGTIRMIYQGTAANTTGTGTQITTSAFNKTSSSDNMYVGYMYTSGQVHGRGTNSTIKGVLDTWYNNNLSSYASYIATGNGATFCNDRQPSTSSEYLNGSGGTGTTKTYYAGFIRLEANREPTFKCADSRDRFDTSIGLITADEVSYAGGALYASNSSYYLYTGQWYWTMTARHFTGTYPHVSVTEPDNSLTHSSTFYELGVRPVINLKADTIFAGGGTGTSSNPYVVS